MINRNKVVAVIPARGGSKRVTRKNIRSFLGKPLLAYTIECAFGSKYIDRVIVSTEDEEIAKVAKESGVNVPFLRPKELASDNVVDFPVIEHAVKWLLDNEKWRADFIVFLRPTCIFRQSEDIDQLLEMLDKTAHDSVRSLSHATYSPYWMKTVAEGRIFPFVDTEYQYQRSQDLPPVYQCNGTVEVIRIETILNKKDLYGQDIGYILRGDEYATIDIDTEIDLLVAECLYNKWKEGFMDVSKKEY